MDCTDRVRENRIYTHPKPVHASHGLIMTLRLYHLDKIKSKENTENMEEIRLGTETCAHGCEADIRKSLIEICQKVITESNQAPIDLGFFIVGSMKHRQPDEEKGKKALGDWILSENNEGDQEYFEAMNNMRPLWYERPIIAKKLKIGIAAGQKIWD
jgi:hypothetical protein